VRQVKKRENCYVLLELLPPLSHDTDDSEAIETQLVLKKSAWLGRIARGQEKYKAYVDSIPEICKIMLGSQSRRIHEAETAAYSYAENESTLERIRSKVIPRNFEDIKSTLSMYNYTDIYDFLSRTPERNVHGNRIYTFNCSTEELLERANILNDNYRNLFSNEATEKMHLSSRIAAFLRENHRDSHDRLLMLETKVALCNAINAIAKSNNGYVNEDDTFEQLIKQSVRVNFSYEDAYTFAHNYCNYKEYKSKQNELPNKHSIATVAITEAEEKANLTDSIDMINMANSTLLNALEDDTILSLEETLLSEIEEVKEEVKEEVQHNTIPKGEQDDTVIKIPLAKATDKKAEEKPVNALETKNTESTKETAPPQKATFEDFSPPIREISIESDILTSTKNSKKPATNKTSYLVIILLVLLMVASAILAFILLQDFL